MAGGRKRMKQRKSARKPKRKSGVMMGMRSGFKNVAASVTGAEAENKSKKSQWLGTAVTVLLVLAAAALLFKRFG